MIRLTSKLKAPPDIQRTTVDTKEDKTNFKVKSTTEYPLLLERIYQTNYITEGQKDVLSECKATAPCSMINADIPNHRAGSEGQRTVYSLASVSFT
jgi:hypothetical protein